MIQSVENDRCRYNNHPELISLCTSLSRPIFARSKDISFSKPVYPLVHPAVLVETFEHGESVSQYVDEPHGNEQIKSALSHTGTNALLKMLLACLEQAFS